MKLSFLGYGAAFYPAFGNTSAYFIIDNVLFILDCGETTFERIYDKVDFKNVDRVYVIITHMHSDHVGSLGSLISYNYCIFKRRIYVVYPEKHIIMLLKLMGIDDGFYHYIGCDEELPCGIKLQPVKVCHVDNMTSYGYIINDGKNNIYYSGDASMIPADIRERFTNGEIEEIYQDTSSTDKNRNNHCYIGELERMIPSEKRSRVHCMHLDCDCVDAYKKMGFSVAGN